MNRLINIIIILLLTIAGPTASLKAEIVTIGEARNLAKNWVATILNNEGNWGGSNSASVEEVMEFKHENRLIGYYCSIKPEGYIIVSLRKELVPVKAYSATGHLNPESEVGTIGMIKEDMAHLINMIEREAGPIQSARTEEIKRIVGTEHRKSWEELERDVLIFNAEQESGSTALGYNPGTWLLSTKWHQAWPYNKECPYKNCVDSELNGHAWVGCTALAAAQIMRYWSWPPSYDWLNMPDSLIWTSPQNMIDAIATLCHDAGATAGMLYTCDWSFLLPEMMAASMRNSFRYNGGQELGLPHSQSEWHEMMKVEINNNRPILYGNGGEAHAYVVDGWKYIGSNVYWHINYGWGGINSTNTWYSRDYAPVTDAIVRDITPGPSMGGTLSLSVATVYGRLSYPYRYFERDCINIHTTTFEVGQNLQFLPGVKLRCLSNYIRFEATLFHNLTTRLYSIKGTQSAGIKIYSGAVELHHNGGLTFLSRQEFPD